MTDGTRADTSGWASGAAPCSPAPPPPDLAQVMGVGVAPGNAQLVVTWTAVDTATSYTVQWTRFKEHCGLGGPAFSQVRFSVTQIFDQMS